MVLNQTIQFIEDRSGAMRRFASFGRGLFAGKTVPGYDSTPIRGQKSASPHSLHLGLRAWHT